MARLARINGLKNVERALRGLERKADNLASESKVQQFMEALLATMPLWVETEFTRVDYLGDSAISVDLVKETPYKWRLVASGEDVLFIEFGTGIVYPPAPNAGEFGFGPRTWSDTHAQRIANSKDGSWYYAKQKTFGNAGANVMPRAADVIEQRLKATFRTVFRS